MIDHLSCGHLQIRGTQITVILYAVVNFKHLVRTAVKTQSKVILILFISTGLFVGK